MLAHMTHRLEEALIWGGMTVLAVAFLLVSAFLLD
jgi:hypothetical protein